MIKPIVYTFIFSSAFISMVGAQEGSNIHTLLTKSGFTEFSRITDLSGGTYPLTYDETAENADWAKQRGLVCKPLQERNFDIKNAQRVAMLSDSTQNNDFHVKIELPSKWCLLCRLIKTDEGPTLAEKIILTASKITSLLDLFPEKECCVQLSDKQFYVPYARFLQQITNNSDTHIAFMQIKTTSSFWKDIEDTCTKTNTILGDAQKAILAQLIHR